MNGIWSDPIVERNDCPACGRKAGEPCRTVVEGVDVAWTHDARIYADMGVRGQR